MKLKPIIIVILCTIFMTVGLSCFNNQEEIQNNSTVFPREVTLEQASEVIGAEVPSPHGMPEGYTVQNIILEDSNTLKLLIVKSDDYNIDLTINKTVVPLKISGVPTVSINGIVGYFYSGEDENMIQWNMVLPSQTTTPGTLFELTLIASKNIPTGEVQIVAESVGW